MPLHVPPLVAVANVALKCSNQQQLVLLHACAHICNNGSNHKNNYNKHLTTHVSASQSYAFVFVAVLLQFEIIDGDVLQAECGKRRVACGVRRVCVKFLLLLLQLLPRYSTYRLHREFITSLLLLLLLSFSLFYFVMRPTT